MILFSQLENITGGKNIVLSPHAGEINAIITDSRKVVTGKGSTFFAITGKHHDSHAFIGEMYEKGIKQFVVENSKGLEQFKDISAICVESSLAALQALVAYHRKQLQIPVIGITGSNGKTIIKEWLFQLLSSDYNIAKNPGSYNSQLGVPLSVWQLQPYHQLGIFEAGISKPGEMEKLEAIIKPSIGIFSNIGSAHDEGFSSKVEKVREKLKLFQHSELVIYCKDHDVVHEEISKQKLKTLSWSFTGNSNVDVRRIGSQYEIKTAAQTFNLSFPFNDNASLENCIHCVCVLLHFGFKSDQIQKRINLLRSVPMRLELKEGINQSQVIDDTYNNDLAGLQISLDFLANQHQKTKKRLILSDLLETGLTNAALSQKIASMVSTGNVHSFIGIGEVLSAHKQFFPATSKFYHSTEEFLEKFNWNEIQHEVILVKGARVFQFEKIVNRLQRKVHGTIMEIDLGAVVKNLNYFRAKLKPSTRIMAMVKAFAYGSGSNEIANLLQFHKVNYLGVAYADEGIELRKNNISLPIMVMNPSPESFDAILEYNLEPEIYSFKILHQYIDFLKGRDSKIHLKIDTGMHRLGFSELDLDTLISILKGFPSITIASIFSHLAGADEATHDNFSSQQATLFKSLADKISTSLNVKPLYHILNSPGILRLPQFQFDMVRLGIGLYGVDPTEEKFEGLHTVATLKTVISQIKEIPQGDSVGYGRRGKAEKPIKIATIAIGYADGFSRAFSRGVGTVLINGKRAQVIGNVCMDMTMIDITGIDAQEGDEVIIFGTGLPIQEVASSINTIPYEILTNTSERVKRVFVAESI